MSMQIPMAAALARGGSVGPVTVTTGPHTLVVDDTGPTPLELMTSSLAVCSALSVCSHLADAGEAADTGDIAVTVTLDAGPPTVLHRRVVLSGAVDGDHLRGLAGVLERTEITRLLRPSYPIRTVIAIEEKPWPSPGK